MFARAFAIAALFFLVSPHQAFGQQTPSRDPVIPWPWGVAGLSLTPAKAHNGYELVPEIVDAQLRILKTNPATYVINATVLAPAHNGLRIVRLHSARPGFLDFAIIGKANVRAKTNSGQKPVHLTYRLQEGEMGTTRLFAQNNCVVFGGPNVLGLLPPCRVVELKSR